MTKSGSHTIKLLMTLMAAAVLAACHSPQSTLARARQDIHDGKYRSATIQLKNLLKDHPENGRGWLFLGRASLMLGSPDDAETELRKAQKHGVSAAKVAVPLARALLAQGEGEKLLTEVKPESVTDTTDRARLLVIRGDAYLASDKPGQAKKSYQAALAIASDNPAATVGLAKVAVANGDTDHAKALLENVKQAHPDDPRAWLLTARMAMAAKDYKQSGEALKHAIEAKGGDLLPQDTFMARAMLAEVEIRQGKFEDAVKQLKPLNKAAPDQPYANYLRALAAYKLKDYKTAETHLQSVLKVSSSSASAELLLGAVNYAEGRLGQAQMHLSNVLGINPSDKKARKLLALTLYKAGQSQQALQVARPLVGKKPSDAQVLAMLSRAEKSSANGDVIGGTPQPGNAAESLQFARHYILTGKNDSAIALLEKMSADKNGAQTDYKRDRLLIVALLRQGDKDKALAKARALVNDHPDEAAPRVLLGGALTATGKNGSARKQFNRALKLKPNDTLARLSLAMLSLKSKDYEGATAQYRKILAHDSANERAMLGMARVEDRQRHADKAVAWVEKARKSNRKALAPRLLLVRYYTAHGKKKEALKVADEAAKIAPKSAVVLNALGIAQLNAGDKDAGIKSFKAAVKAAPNAANVRTNLARAEIANGQAGDAADELEHVVNQHPHYVPAVSLYALAQIQSGRLYEGVALAKSLRKSDPVVAYTLEGDLYMLDKQFSEAVDAYRQALKQKPSQRLVAKELAAASAAKKKGGDTGALAWLKKHPEDVALRAGLGDYYMAVNDSDDAMQQYRAVIKKYPNNVGVLNNLAWLYSLQHNKKAVALAKKAHKIAPKAPQITDTLGWALLQTGNTEQAIKVLREAVSQQPKSASMQYHLASALAHDGQKDQARDMLKKLLASKDDFDARDDAKKLYASLK